MGRLTEIQQPTGEVTELKTDVNTTGSIVRITTDGRDAVAMATYGSVQSAMHGKNNVVFPLFYFKFNYKNNFWKSEKKNRNMELFFLFF
jgi:hypothetical protein